jgi:hypothetical protein
MALAASLFPISPSKLKTANNLIVRTVIFELPIRRRSNYQVNGLIL